MLRTWVVGRSLGSFGVGPVGLLGSLALAAAVSQACSPVVEEEQVETVINQQESGLRASDVGPGLVQANVLSAGEGAALLALRVENEWDVFRTPAVVGPQDEYKVVIIRLRKNNGAQAWSHALSGRNWIDVPGTAFTLGEKLEGFVFNHGKATAGTIHQAAIKIVEDSWISWLNNGGNDYRCTVAAGTNLAWAGDLSLAQDGVPVLAGGLARAHDLTVGVQSYPVSPGVRATVHYKVNSERVQSVLMSLVSINAGMFRNNMQWTARLPTSGLERGAHVTFWIEIAGPLNTVWHSNQGANHHVDVRVDPPQPTWGRAGSRIWAKYEVYYRAELGDPILRGQGSHSYLPPTRPVAEVFIPGITDRADVDPEGGFVMAQVYSTLFSGKPDGEWQSRPLGFWRKEGNNWLFDWEISEIRYVPNFASLMYPTGADWAVDGNYPYKLRISTDQGKTWHWLGTEGFPWGGQNRTVGWTNYVREAGLTTVGSLDFPDTAVRQTSTQRIEFVHTNNYQLRMSRIALQDQTGAFSATVEGCASLSTCTAIINPGDRVVVDVTFAPAQRGQAQATLELGLESTVDPRAMFGTMRIPAKGNGI